MSNLHVCQTYIDLSSMSIEILIIWLINSQYIHVNYKVFLYLLKKCFIVSKDNHKLFSISSHFFYWLVGLKTKHTFYRQSKTRIRSYILINKTKIRNHQKPDFFFLFELSTKYYQILFQNQKTYILSAKHAIFIAKLDNTPTQFYWNGGQVSICMYIYIHINHV